MLLVYDITHRDSFLKIKSFHDDFKNNTKGSCAFVLIGNKLDSSERVVTYEEGKKLSISIKMPFIECSAYTGENINKIFDTVLSEIECLSIKIFKDKDSFYMNEKQKRKPKQVSKCC